MAGILLGYLNTRDLGKCEVPSNKEYNQPGHPEYG